MNKNNGSLNGCPRGELGVITEAKYVARLNKMYILYTASKLWAGFCEKTTRQTKGKGRQLNAKHCNKTKKFDEAYLGFIRTTVGSKETTVWCKSQNISS